MTIAEPMTMATDYVLAAVSSSLCWTLSKRRERERSRGLWCLALAALAVAALLGGTYHGFRPHLGASVLVSLWKITVLTVGLANFAMAAAAIFAGSAGRARRLLLGLAAAKLVLFSSWMLGHDEFVYVVVDTTVTLLLVSVLHGRLARQPASRWMLAGVAVSVAAGAVQASRIALAPGFNHNDLYHGIQLVAVVLFYRGALLVTDADGLEHAAVTLPVNR